MYDTPCRRPACVQTLGQLTKRLNELIVLCRDKNTRQIDPGLWDQYAHRRKLLLRRVATVSGEANACPCEECCTKRALRKIRRSHG